MKSAESWLVCGGIEEPSVASRFDGGRGFEGAFRVNSVTMPLKEETRILLCTDGLHDIVSDSDIVDVMIQSRPSDWKWPHVSRSGATPLEVRTTLR